ncbi:unconventional myosin-XVB isoform X1 [Rhincodon typus]|uniref:unconventional myosin-XVB isoform X1 n=2 Tax=Rhincodon typus TaxID=259920 RepID=UPI0020302156|nr:unconventional myosin-XVB isoform X1 [Rhincodon typus]
MTEQSSTALFTAPWNRRIFSRSKGRGTAVGMDVGLLEIPAELAALLQFDDRQPPAFENQVAEVSPPQAKAIINNSLPADVNNYPFSKFINQHFKVPQLQVLDQPLQQPLTQLEGAERHAAVEIFKLVLRFLHDELLNGRKEIILGNFIAQKGISNPTLRNEIFCQVVNQTWKNPDMENWQRACLLMTTCLSCLRPSPELEKPLLKYVSDHTMEEYRALCQHKALSAMQQNQGRAYPPTQLEWTANRRRGQMVLDIHLLNEDKVAAEVESWTTGEELANWILKLRNQENEQRGWTVSLHNGEKWRDMPGCDFVMDLIAEVEQLGFFPAHSSTSVIHPGVNGYSTGSHPGSDNCYLPLSEECEGVIPPAPNIQAPRLPPPFLSHDQSDMHSYGNSAPKSETSRCSFENYLDNLFDPVLSHGAGEMERSRDLNRRMKGGGGIGPSQAGAYMMTGMPMVPNYSMGVPAMSQMPTVPTYQTMPLMPAMQSMPIMQQMPPVQPVPMMQPMASPMPAMMMPQSSVPQMTPMHQTSQYAPSQLRQPERQIDSSQLAAQQQTFINQQALLLAQQMTIQAMSISQQQQQERQQKKQREEQPVAETPKAPRPPKTNTKPIIPTPAQQPKKTSVKTEPFVKKDLPKEKEVPPQDTDVKAESNDIADELIMEQVESFQQKRDFFQKWGKKDPPQVKHPSKILLPKPPEKKKTEESSNCEVQEHKERPPPENSTKGTKQKDKEKEKEQKTEEKSKEPEEVKPIQSNTRPEPSQNIREIIKLYQSQPKQPPPLYQPVRRSAKPFLKKSNPKDEALSLLRMRESASPTEVENGVGKKTKAAKVPPKPAPKPHRHPPSSQLSIQDQLAKIYAPPPAEPSLPSPPPPPPPGPSSASTSTSEFQLPPVQQKREEVFLQDENIKTHLYRKTASVYFSYVNIPWKLYLRKELFHPREKFNTDYILNLMCEQIIRDTYSDSCTRISKEERHKMRDLLAELHVGTDVRLLQDNALKKRIVVAARDNWAVYFSRMFPVSGDIGSDVQILSISHRGIKLLKSVQAIGMKLDHFKVLQSYCYAEILNVTLKEQTMLEFSLKNEQLVLYSEKAKQAKILITLFLEELRKDSDYVMAIKSYITDDKCLLNFRKGDIIKLLPIDGLQPGWQFGSIGGRSGLFPGDHAQPTAAPDYYSSYTGKNEERQKSTPSSNRSSMRKSAVPSEVSENMTISSRSESSNPLPNIHSSPDFVQYIMAEFAMKYFRNSPAMLGWKDTNAEGRNPNSLVQHTKIPIHESLIDLPDKQLSELAAKNFMALMRFMGDGPPQEQQSDTDILQSILQLCKEKRKLQDEICCQIIKQITDHPIKENCTRGWRVLYLFLGYFPCTSDLMPFVQRYLENICADSNHDFQAIAMACQDNVYRTLKYGGRQHIPSTLELEAIIKGRSSRRVIVYLPGKLEHAAKIKPFMVGQDMVMEICANIGIVDSEEVKEFSIFADRKNGDVVRPIKANEYIFDFLLDDNSISLHFRRVIWTQPLHFYNDLCVSVHYNQVLPIYLKGQLLFPTNIHGAEQHTAILAAYQHKTKGSGPMLDVQQLKAYLPKTIAAKLNIERVLKQTIQELETMQELSPVKAKIQFLCEVKAMPLFGYNVFTVNNTSEHWIPTPCILGVNQEDLIILNENTKCELLKIPLMEIHTMRSLHPTKGSKIREMEINFGSIIKPQTIALELKEAREVCHIIAMILDELSMHSDT